jgi:hypothetical protein
MINFPGEYGAGQFSGANGAMSEHSEPTGRYVVVFADNLLGDESASTAALQSIAGVSNVLSARDFRDGGINIEEARDADATLFPTLGVAVVAGDPDRLASLTAAVGGDDRIEAVEPERILHALSQPGMLAADYLRGYRDAAIELYQHANGGGNGAATAVGVAAQFVDTAEFTWGLQATRASTSGRSGQGVGVAILDTGVAVYSSWSTASSSPRRYNTISGTSTATAHVAGIAALLVEATGATGTALWGQLVRTAQRLPIPSVDVGAGLVQAPQ